jgi:alpha-1,2-mannosyltransferase
MKNSRVYPVVAAAVAGAAGIFAFTIASGLLGSWRLAIPIAAIGAALVLFGLLRRPILAFADDACPKALRIVSALTAAGSLVALGRLAIFIVSPAQVGFSCIPSSNWELGHSCVSAYYVAAEAAGRVENIYDDALYSVPATDPRAPRRAKPIGQFRIDVYEYPPPFLLAPRALLLATPDFLRFRMVWFGLTCGTMLWAMLLVARRLGPAAGSRAILLSPLIWLMMPTLTTLQKGNVQFVVIALAVVAMALFERGRHAAGGALLAYTIVSKLYPGLLVLFLLVRRDWRALGWTAAFGLVLLVATYVDLGAAPFAAFVDHMPRLLSGEAFPALRNPGPIVINHSIPGLVFKAKLLGLADIEFGASRIVGWIYTLVAAALTILIARRARGEAQQPLAWLAIVILGTLRSPFLPQGYAGFPVVWLLTLFVALQPPTGRTLAMALAAWLALSIYIPLDRPMDIRLLAATSAIPQVVMLAVTAVVLLALARRWPPAKTVQPAA